jgi:hypothetical protein
VKNDRASQRDNGWLDIAKEKLGSTRAFRRAVEPTTPLEAEIKPLS